MSARTANRVNEAFEDLIRAGNLGDVVNWVRSLPLEEIPITHRVIITAQVPSPDGSAIPAGTGSNAFWGNDEISPLAVKNPNPSVGIISVYNSFSSGAALQADLFQVGLGTTIAGPDERFVVLGNMFTPQVEQGPQFGLSPDDFTLEDIAQSAVSGIAPDMIPAAYDHGGWAWAGCEDFSDGWNMKYTIGDRVDLIDDPVSSIASCGNRRTGHGMSSSLIETTPFVKEVNSIYQKLSGGNPFGTRQFVPINAERTGLAPNGQTYVSTFKPSRLGDLAKASFGLISNHPLYTNPCMRTFASPILIKAGVPFNLTYLPKNRAFVAKFLADIGATFNGNEPSNGFVQSPDPSMQEWDWRRTPPAAQTTTTSGKRITIKDGFLRWETCFYGFSLIEKALIEALGRMRDQYGAVGLVPVGYD